MSYIKGIWGKWCSGHSRRSYFWSRVFQFSVHMASPLFAPLAEFQGFDLTKQEHLDRFSQCRLYYHGSRLRAALTAFIKSNVDELWWTKNICHELVWLLPSCLNVILDSSKGHNNSVSRRSYGFGRPSSHTTYHQILSNVAFRGRPFQSHFAFSFLIFTSQDCWY